MITYMFPGQGSQFKGMGEDLFAQFPDEIALAQDILGYSIYDLCVNDPEQLLNNTAYTQPALFVVEALSYQSKYSHTKPEYCIGHSLGEYAALYVAGAFDFATGLKMVQKRGKLMALATGGGMLAVVGLPVDRIKELLEQNGIDTVDFANYNSNKQTVLSGLAIDISRANEVLAKEAMMCVPLNVSGAFHSRYMEPAAKEFAAYIEQFQMSPLKCQVIANVSGLPYTDEIIHENLVKQIYNPVHWSDIIKYIKGKGESEFIEVGPGNVLTRLMSQN
ncbi:MAG TPA: ACP S-malonyltransferase [Legionella sp.]|nr:ACP S-malonyltransferase [Legionella sp.]